MMLNPKLAIAALTTTTVSLYSAAAQAYTLFQDNQTSATPYQETWISPVKATIELEALLSNMTGDLTASIWVDNDQVANGTYNFTNPNNPGKLEIGSTLDVEVGSVIRFEVQPKGQYNFDIGIDLVEKSGLVFLGERDRPFSHVGFHWDGEIYESSPPYTHGQYWDIVRENYRSINPDNGVQKEHSFGSFLHVSPDKNSSPTQRREYVRIPDQPEPYSQNYAEKMRNFIETRLGNTYPSSLGSTAFLNPYQQKCYFGQCTGVGLIERASEEAKIRGGQGFIPNVLEAIPVENIFTGPTLDAAPWECLITFPMTPDCKARADRGSGGAVISVLSPHFQHYWIQQLNADYKDWLQGWFQNIDFMLTDPQGNKLEYRDGTWTQTGEIPGVFYTATDSERHFYIPQRLAGNYSLEFFGKGLCKPDAIAVLGNNQDGTLISGCKEPPPSEDGDHNPNPTEQVPEPSTLLGLATLGLLGMRTRQKVRNL